MAASTKPNFFLRRPVLSAVLSIIITLVGTLALKVLPVAQYPDLIPPTVNIVATYPGASAETIASTVLAPLEVNINGVENMLYMTSTASSAAGIGIITVTFALGTNSDIALVNVNNKVNLAQNLLPASVRQIGVSVTKRSPSMLQGIAFFSPDGRYDDVFLHNYMQINILDELKRVDGVGDCQVFGQADYSMRIWLIPDKLAKYNLAVTDIVAAISEQNSQFAPGRLGESPSDSSTLITWQIDTQGRFSTPEEFGNIILRAETDSAILRLRDVAKIEMGGRDYAANSRINGQVSRMGAVYLRPGANAIATGERVKAKLEELSKSFPEGLEYRIVVDTNNFVLESIKEVIKTLFEAMVLVVIVVWVFLQNWRATLIPCIAVPVSIVGTFAGMYIMGYTINTLTLFGLVLAIGIVVDDAIVVLENVERIMSTEHLPPKEATAKAMNEVTAPVIAIVLVLCAVFIPVSFMGGIAGQMYKQFAVTISISVVLSGIVALTLTPALCGLILKPVHENEHQSGPFHVFNKGFDWLTGHYVGTVRLIKNHAFFALLCSGAIVAVAWLLFKVVPSSLVPDEDQGYFLGVAILDDGASVHRTLTVSGMVSDILLKDEAVSDVMVINGLDITSLSLRSNYATYFVNLKPWEERLLPENKPDALVRKVMGVTMMQPEGVVLGFTPPPISGMSTTGGFECYLQLRGSGTIYDLEATANKLIQEVMAKNADGTPKHPEIASLRSLFSTNSPQLFASLDRERCKDMGIAISDVFTAMSGTFGMIYVNDFYYSGRTFQVRMQSDRDYRMLPESINDIYVRSQRTGEMVPLSAVLTLQRRTAPQTIDRYNVFPAAHMLGAPAPGYTTGQAMAAMERIVAEVAGIDYNLGWVGSSLQEKLSSADTATIFILALVMVFLILAAQYESWSLPLAVLTAVPFGIFGALLATWGRGLSNDVYFQVALVTLIGLAAKNAILIVEFAVEAWRSGKSLDVAALHAARLRFRPIIMTSLAFILGCVPLAVSAGAGANSRHAIGTAVIGGMLAATFIATLFIPFFFKSIMYISLKLRGKSDPNLGKGSEEDELHSAV